MLDDVKVYIEQLDDVFMKVVSTKDVEYELRDYFTITIPDYKNKRLSRISRWDGKKRMYNVHTKKMYIGLLPYLKKWLTERNYSFHMIAKENADDENFTPETAYEFIQSLDTGMEFRYYQGMGFYHAIKEKRSVLLSSTGSGKSLIIYYIIRWLIEKGHKGLLVVPTVALVKQMYGDFQDYSVNNGWSVEDNCHKIHQGQEKFTDKPLIITTWQSIYEFPESYYGGREFIVGDEADEFSAESLIRIMENLKHTPYRIGTTGTLQTTKVHYLTVEGLFGKAKILNRTKQLMDEDVLAPLEIDAIILTYDDKYAKALYKKGYNNEINFLIGYKPRNEFIKNLALTQKSNTLILYRYVEKHGLVLYNTIKENLPKGRKVFFIHGNSSVSEGHREAEEREQVRKVLENETDAILIASMGVFSRGSNLKNLHNLILASPMKSRTRNLQSIGRILRKASGKEKATLYDIGDDLKAYSEENYSLKHFKARLEIYMNEKFTYKIHRGVKI